MATATSPPEEKNKDTHMVMTQASEEYYSLVCLPCHRDDTTMPAFGYCIDCDEHLCHPCYKHHRKANILRHHKLQGKDAMPSMQKLADIPEQAGATDNMTTPCPRHKGEIQKFFCRDHDVLLCGVCVAMEHTISCHVDYIPDISDQIIDSQEYKDIVDNMETLLQKCTNIQTKRSGDINKSRESLEIALQDFKRYREETNQRLQQLQKELETKIEALQQHSDDRLKAVETTSAEVKKMLMATNDNIKHLNSSKQANELFKEVKQAQKHLNDYENSISSIPVDEHIAEYEFIPNQEVRDVLQKEHAFGAIAMKHKTLAESSPEVNSDATTTADLDATSTYDNITPTYLGDICVQTSDDEKRCAISSMTMLSPDQLVLLDNNNNSIKLVDVNSKSITSQLSLGDLREDKLFDITSTTSTQVAVTVPGRQQIQFISVSDKLSKAGTIQSGGNCYGISCHDDKLVVTYCRPGKLEILDKTGKLITGVKTELTGKEVFHQPLRVQANISAIYASDKKYSEIIKLNWKGDVTSRFGDLQQAAGLPAALLGDGRLLVCRSNSIAVCQVSADGTNCKTVLRDMRSPVAACVEDGGHKLYISRCTGHDNQIDNNILVYNI